MTKSAHPLPARLLAAFLSVLFCPTQAQSQDQTTPVKQAKGRCDWLSWRGPLQTGASLEGGLPAKIEIGDTGGNWSYTLCGRGTPVISQGRVFAMGYQGEKAELQEKLVCLEESTGKLLWERSFTDMPTDIIYYRYAIGSPTIDGKTGHVYCMSTAGLLCGFDTDGKLLWQRSMMSEYGRLTFPNGRTGAPLLVDDLVIIHTVTSAWGKHGPARDRFFAFDKATGKSVWTSTPGGPPKDVSFSFPVVAQENGRKVLYAGLGGGHLVSVCARTGDPLWRFQMSIGGLSTSPVLFKDRVICIHGKENLDSSTIGRMVAIRRGAQAEGAKPGPITLGKSHELWRNDLVAFTSSPVLAGDKIYQTVLTGELYCVDAKSGKALWHEKLAPDQIHASPAYGDGKLYVPMNNGSLHIVAPDNKKGERVLQSLQLEGNCLGAPAIANGAIYVHTTKKLYRFAGGTGKAAVSVASELDDTVDDKTATRLQVVPADMVYQQGQGDTVQVRGLNKRGRRITASVQATFENLPEGVTVQDGRLQVSESAKPTSQVVTVSQGDLHGTMRLRIVPKIPFADGFEAQLKPHPKEDGVMFARPRPHWVGAGLKWEIRKLGDEHVLAKTIDRPLFQRTMSMIGHPKMRNYTVQVDIRSDGNRRMVSSAGVVNQRYLIVLKGNHQALEVSSNMELLKQSVRFRWKPKTWYRLKTRVDIAADGTGTIRAKVWKRDEPEPNPWTLEVQHSHPHTEGSPGIYGFVPQSRFMVYLDNLSVTPSKPAGK